MSQSPRGRDDDIDARFAEIMGGIDWDLPETDEPVTERKPRRPQPPPGPAAADVNPAYGESDPSRGHVIPPARPDDDSRRENRPGDRGRPLEGRGADPDDGQLGGPRDHREEERDDTLESWRAGPLRDEDEHFVPPDPEPLPAGDLQFWAILLGLTLGPVLAVLGFGFGALSPVFGWIGLISVLGGFGLLLLRLPTHRDDTDTTGGARV